MKLQIQWIRVPIVFVAAAFTVASVYLYGLPGIANGTYVLFFLCIALLTRVRLYLPHGESVAPAMTVSAAALLVFPYPSSLLLIGLGTVASWLISRRSVGAGRLLVVDASRLVLSGIGALAIYQYLGGLAPGAEEVAQAFLINPWPVLALFSAFHILSFSMEEFGLSIHRNDARLSLGQLLELGRLMGPAHLALACIGILTTILMEHLGVWVIILLVCMLMLFRHALKLYLDVADAYDETIKALATAIDVHEPVDGPTAASVELIARAVGRELRLTRGELEILSRAALLINLGKIGLDDPEVTAHENSPNHASRAAKILSKAEGLRLVGLLVEHQDIHYSQLRLPAREVLLTQCLFVAKLWSEDVDAGRTSTEVLGHLKREAGKAYHPKVVRAFQRVIARGYASGLDDPRLTPDPSERSLVTDSPPV